MFDTAIFKIAGKCNIACTYCYVYNLADSTSNTLPIRSEKRVIEAFFARLKSYLVATDKRYFHIVIHGGEPLLAGFPTLRYFIDLCRRVEVETNSSITMSLQTNGMLLTEEWIDLFHENKIRIGISLDGPQDIHDQFRVSRRNSGTHERVESIVKHLVQNPEWNAVFSGVLAVLNPRANGAELVRYFYKLGVRNINFLLPDQNYDQRFNSDIEMKSLGGILLDAYVAWREIDDPRFRIGMFSDVLGYFLTGRLSDSDSLSGNPISILTVETNGAVEPLDVFKCCGRELTRTDLSVFNTEFAEAADYFPFSLQLDPRSELSAECKACSYLEICGGGYLPHRMRDGRFDSPTIFCPQLKPLFRLIENDVGCNLGGRI